MHRTAPESHFVPVADRDRVDRLVYAGLEQPAQRSGGASVDGLWRETGRSDRGVLFLLIDVAGRGICLLGRPDIHEEGEPVFPDQPVKRGEGDRYLAVTDGITEAGRPHVLGSEGVLELLNSLPGGLEPDVILAEVFALAAT